MKKDIGKVNMVNRETHNNVSLQNMNLANKTNQVTYFFVCHANWQLMTHIHYFYIVCWEHKMGFVQIRRLLNIKWRPIYMVLRK